MMTKRTFLSLALIFLTVSATSAFAPASNSVAYHHHHHHYYDYYSRSTSFSEPAQPPIGFTAPMSSTQLYEKRPYNGMKGNDGIGNGIVIQLLVFAICTWLFTIPPEFRRAYICPAEIFCREDEGGCTRECVTQTEWIQGVSDYYKNGGGVRWDFSIDPKTKEANQNKIDAILGKTKTSDP